VSEITGLTQSSSKRGFSLRQPFDRLRSRAPFSFFCRGFSPGRAKIVEKKEVKYLAAELPELDEGQATAALRTPPRNSWEIGDWSAKSPISNP
jgi:hypothetical protein